MSLIEFHKKNHTVLLVIEGMILTLISFFVAPICIKSTYALEPQIEFITSEWIYSFDYLLSFVPFLFNILLIVFILVIIFIRDKKSNPIKAKKLTKYLFYLSVAFFIIDFLAFVFLSNMIIINKLHTLEYIYDYKWGFLICSGCAFLFAIDINIWRYEFGLNKFYGNGLDIYR